METNGKTDTELMEFLLSIISNAPYGMIAIDLNGEIIMANEHGINHLDPKLKTDEVVGMHISELIGNMPKLQKIIGKILKEGRAPFDLISAHHNGRYLTIKGRLLVKSYLLVIEDVSVAKKAELVAKNEIRNLRKIEELKTQFLGITSHELKTPLTPAKIHLQLMDEERLGKLNDKQRDSLDTVIKNLDHLDKLIDDILSISQMQSGTLKLQPENTDINECATEAISITKALAEEKNIKLVHKLGKVPKTKADRKRILEIITNLITNAIKFTPKGTITVKTRTEKGNIKISIKDSGIGMAKKETDNIFKPFYQIDKTYKRKQAGVGLGLNICKGLVEQHGGRLWVESKTGKGSTFHFTIPLEETTPAEKENGNM